MSRTQLKTTNIKGKEYVEVNTRVQYFRECPDYKGWSLETEIIELDEKRAVLRAVIKDKDERVIATGMAYENANSTYINKTSYIENCETSAWGRALGNLGIGIGTSIASSEEVKNAIENQKKLTPDMLSKFDSYLDEASNYFDIKDLDAWVKKNYKTDLRSLNKLTVDEFNYVVKAVNAKVADAKKKMESSK